MATTSKNSTDLITVLTDVTFQEQVSTINQSDRQAKDEDGQRQEEEEATGFKTRKLALSLNRSSLKITKILSFGSNLDSSAS